jgi:hypothetical protein
MVERPPMSRNLKVVIRQQNQKTERGVEMTPTELLIIDQMWERSMSVMMPSILKLAGQEDSNEELESFLSSGKEVWKKMMSEYLSKSDIENLIKAFYASSQIDEKKLKLFNAVYTTRIIEIAEECFN